MQVQIRKNVLTVKTSVSSQLAQLKNNLSGYEGGFSEASINWVQLDPFFVLADVENKSGVFKVTHLVARSNTPAERWSAAYLEAALKINRSKDKSPIQIQLFKDRSNSKFILIRFLVGGGKELVLASTADYFQKFFDIERGGRNKSLLITTQNILAGHSEGDYLATASKEALLSPKKYVIEKEEIVGTNLTAVSYVLKSKIVAGFAIPWSIVGVVLGLGFILIGILYYSLDPIERRVERYRNQEREQIYKDTLQQTTQQSQQTPNLFVPVAISGVADIAENEETVKKSINLENPHHFSVEEESAIKVPVFDNSDEENASLEQTKTKFTYNKKDVEPERAPFELSEPDPEIINLFERTSSGRKLKIEDQPQEKAMADEEIQPDIKLNSESEETGFVTLDEEKIDLDEIEKALALDDFDEEEKMVNTQAQALEKNLQPQKISLSSRGASIERPQFVFEKKEFKVDDIKINIRRPERS